MPKLEQMQFHDDEDGDSISEMIFSPGNSAYVVVRVPSPDTYASDKEEYLYALAVASAYRSDKVTVTPFVTAPTMQSLITLRELVPAKQSPSTNYGAY